MYVIKNNIHTNTIEGIWSNLRRSLYGVYHQVSEKHLQRYLNEFTARYNASKEEVTEMERLDYFLKQAEGGLLYKVLTYNEP